MDLDVFIVVLLARDVATWLNQSHRPTISRAESQTDRNKVLAEHLTDGMRQVLKP